METVLAQISKYCLICIFIWTNIGF